MNKMKHFKKIYTSLLIILVIISCTDNRDLDFLETVALPTNISATYNITQDNTGLVTITPLGEGAIAFEIGLGDGSPTIELNSGESTSHIYAEGSYEVTITAFNILGDSAEATQQLIVSFQAPQNLVVAIENDAAISKQVNITANADFAAMYDFDSGETGATIVSANIGETINYQYTDPGTYSISVVAKGGAIQTTEYTVDFEVTEILAPIASVATPPTRNDVDVISIFSDAYTDVAGTDYNPNWGQATVYTAFDLNGDAMLQYSNLNYQGIDIGQNVDASTMEFIHIDIWTPDATSIDIFPLPNGVVPADERFVTKTLTPNQWNSFDIPVSDFTSQGLPIDNLKQFKFVGSGTVFIDNLYFHKAPSGASPPLLSDDFEGNGNIPSWVGDAAGANTSFANPFNNADNFSETVLEYTDTGGTFANVNFTAPSKFDLTNGQSVYSIKIYVPSSSVTGSQPNQVSLKLQNSDLGGNSWQTQTEVIKPIVLDQWQTITFDFVNDNWVNINFTGTDPDPVDRTDLDKVVIQVNSENNNDAVTAYIDDFYYGVAQIPQLPPFVKDGFEGQGTITNWTGDSAGADIAFANPFVNADNNSPTVLEYADTGGQFANVNFTATDKFNIADKGTFSIKIYVPSSSISGTQPNQVSLKLQNSALGGNSWQTQTEVVKPIVLDQWQIITFDFVNDNWMNINFTGTDPDPINRTDLDKVVIQVNSENNNDPVTAYIDNVDYY
jgi:hypothetical protein